MICAASLLLSSALSILMADVGQTQDAQLPPRSSSQALEAASEAASAFYFRVSGDKELRPVSIHDDGRRTFIRWRQDQAIPAIFIINAQGEEVAAAWRLIDGTFVIQGVPSALRFRIDKDVAKATRKRR